MVLTPVILSAIFYGCASDIILTPPPSLKGVYVGEYRYTRDYGAPNQVLFKQPINWTFEDQSFRMEIDTTSPNLGTHSFCKVSGQYALTTGVRIQIVKSQPMGGQFTACTASENPEGTFTLIRSNDTLFLSLQEDTDLREIVLKPKP